MMTTNRDRDGRGLDTRTFTVSGLALGLLTTFATPTFAAGYEFYEGREDQSLKVRGEAAAATFSSRDDYSGQDRDRVTWTEGYAEIGLDGERRTSALPGNVYGSVSGLWSGTQGDGDPGGFTTGEESRVDIEDFYVGWRSDGFESGDQFAMDVSAGSQEVIIGSGWLVAGDSLNLGEGFGSDLDRGGAYWLAARRAFRTTGMLELRSPSPFSADVFFLGSDNEGQGDTELAGTDFRYDASGLGSLAFTYLKATHVDEEVLPGDPIGLASRDGLNTFSLRGDGNLGIENAEFAFEYTLQRGSPSNSQASRDVEAHAWYAEAGYQFADLPLAPQLRGRFSTFSGDDPDSSDNEAFDPLFFGFTRGFGTWFQGEIAGNFTGPFNTNSDIWHGALYLHPTPEVRVGALWFDFTLDEPGSRTRNGLSSDDWGSEFNLFAEIPISENMFVSPLYSRFEPGDAAEEQFGTDKTNHYFQVVAVLNF